MHLLCTLRAGRGYCLSFGMYSRCLRDFRFNMTLSPYGEKMLRDVLAVTNDHYCTAIDEALCRRSSCASYDYFPASRRLYTNTMPISILRPSLSINDCSVLSFQDGLCGLHMFQWARGPVVPAVESWSLSAREQPRKKILRKNTTASSRSYSCSTSLRRSHRMSVANLYDD